MEPATIAALATPPGRGAIGILRVSGPGARAAVSRLAPTWQPRPRLASLVTLRVEGVALDEALALFFSAPHSFTGEDVVELHLHGSPRLLRLVLDELVRAPGVRLAQPGEFTRRALMNGRLTWTKAEAVVDLIEARSESEAKAAAARLTGVFSRVLDELYQPLLALSAELEGALDFPDEAPDLDPSPALAQLLALATRLEQSAARARSLHQGALVVLYGPVNAGKSTLFNRLVGSARALVDAEPGTTRDALEATLELDGQLVTLVDTAGLREGPGRVEAMGIARTHALLAEADVAVLLLPPETSAEAAAQWRAAAAAEKRLDVASKCDLGGTGAALAVSGQSGVGVENLLKAVQGLLAQRVPAGENLAAGHHHEPLVRARAALERAGEAAVGSTLEVVAGEVSLALSALAEVAGLNVTEARLDALFARFCIGK